VLEPRPTSAGPSLALSLTPNLCAFASLREISLWNCDDLATLD
jgi:hypothetical protein